MTEKIDRQRQRFVQLLREDPRYPWQAYLFVREALCYAQDVLEMGSPADEALESEDFAAGEFPEIEPDDADDEESAARPERHLTGQQLCHAVRCYSQEQFGYMAQAVLAHWGIRATRDIGEIVYNLIRIGQMKKSPTDRREDFDDVFDFDEALRQDYQITRVQG